MYKAGTLNKYDKIRRFCRPIRMLVGLSLITTGIATGIIYFYLGVIPFMVGLANICPLCIVTKKCSF
jgi:hypothetical protein